MLVSVNNYFTVLLRSNLIKINFRLYFHIVFDTRYGYYSSLLGNDQQLNSTNRIRTLRTQSVPFSYSLTIKRLSKMKKSFWLELCCSLLVLLFIYACASKLLDIQQFIHDMHNQPFPVWFSNFLIVAVPFSEILISACLLFRKSQRVGLIASVILMFLFTLYATLVLLHIFSRVPCSCGGVIKHLTWTQHMILNLFFTGLAITGIILSKPTRQKQSTMTAFA